jgi:hypothetical protein
MTEEKKIDRKEFDKLRAQYLEFAKSLRERDRHARGGTTLGEMMESGDFDASMQELARDPEYIKDMVATRLKIYLGEHEGWAPSSGELRREVFFGGGIAMLGKTNQDGRPFPHPAELGLRAARSIGRRKATNLINHLRENAALCNALADAFEHRVDSESGIRRVQ